MRKLIPAFIIFVLVGTIACSDFENSKPNPQASPTVLNQGPKPNPFEGGKADPDSGAFTEEKMLVNIGLNVVAPQVRRFRVQTEILEMRVTDYCEALKTGEEVTERETSAKNQWIETMLEYNRLEAAPIGPLGDKNLGLAVGIYAYPYSATCVLDSSIAANAMDQLPQLTFAIKGLSALEYLLFEPKLGSSCFRPNPATAAWIAKPDVDKKRDRCEWSKALSKDLVQKSILLENYWDTEKGNYTKTLIDSSVFPTLREATNNYSDSMFSIERLKDQRLGRPLGLHPDCPEEEATCPTQVEHPYSGIAFLAQAETIKFFKKAFLGNGQGIKSFGMDDLLKANGAEDAAIEIIRKADAALNTNRALRENGNFLEQLKNIRPRDCEASTPTDRKEELCAYQKEVRDITQVLKIEILTALSLKAPASFQGDSD